MMQAPQIESVSRLARDYRSMLAKLKAGPVFLIQRSKAAAVLVSFDEWNRRARRLAELEGLVEAKRAIALIDSGQMGTISHDELKRLMQEKASQNVGD